MSAFIFHFIIFADRAHIQAAICPPFKAVTFSPILCLFEIAQFSGEIRFYSHFGNKTGEIGRVYACAHRQQFT